jgi:hypothetical protein
MGTLSVTTHFGPDDGSGKFIQNINSITHCHTAYKTKNNIKRESLIPATANCDECNQLQRACKNV